MSNTFSIACKDCKVHVWIAQGHDKDNGCFYHGEEKVVKNFYRFLQEHRGHHLFFEDNCNSYELESYKEIEW